MATLREVKTRIKSVKNIAQITRALEAVSASRVRKAQARVLASRAFAEKAWEILVNLQNASKGKPLHALLEQREETKNIMVVVITSDRGLAGAFNSNVLRVVDRFVQSTEVDGEIQFVAVGTKGRDSLVRQGANLVAEFTNLPPEPSISDVAPIARLAVDAYLNGEVDEVLVAYTDFVSMLAQRPTVLGWLPLTTETIAHQIASEYVKDVPEVSDGSSDYEYEPNAETVTAELVPRFTELQLYQALLESVASEHAARMAAMRNASDNAEQLTEDLTLVYNKARQAAITSEILDIVGGAEALQATLDAKADDILAESPMVTVVPPAPTPPSNGGGLAATKAAVAEAVAEAEPAVAVQTDAPTGKKPKMKGENDLTIIEGIGPKMNQALIDAGIGTFALLAEATDEQIIAAIEAAGMRFAPSLSTWAEQAGYAARGDWDGLERLKDSLVGGRKE